MLMLCKELEERLDKVWFEIQTSLQATRPGISQIDLDTLSVELLEITARKLTEQVDQLVISRCIDRDIAGMARTMGAKKKRVNEPQVVEASQLQLKPGSWPGVLSHDGKEWTRGAHLPQQPGIDFAGYVYNCGTLRLHVLND